MNLVKEFLLLKAKVDKLYCQLIAKSPDEQDPTVPNHVKTIKQEDIDNWNNVKEEEVQITEDTAFAQTGQTQKYFNKKVSDYKASSDLKNQEQDDRMSDIESENVAQNDLINGLQADLDNQIAINANQDERINTLEGINYTWSPTNRTLTLYDNNGNQLSQVSLVSLDNEGTDIRYNASTLSLELYNSDNELLDSIPVSSFIGSVGTQLQLNSNQLQLKDSQGNTLSTVTFEISNINNLQTALNGKLDKGGYGGTAQDIYNRFEGKIQAGLNGIPKVVNGAFGTQLGSSTISEINNKIGISIAGEPSEQLEVGGNVKAKSNKFTLPSVLTPQPNMLIAKIDGSGLIWYNNSSVANNIPLFPINFNYGNGSGNLTYNTAYGNLALNSNSSGNYNLAIGNQTMRNNTTGNSNTAIGGDYTMGSNTTGGSNTAIGNQSLQSNTTGSDNVAVGRFAGRDSNGNGNVFVGSISGKNYTSSEATFVGAESGGTGTFSVALGYRAGANQSGGLSVYIGHSSGYNITTGTRNVAIGHESLIGTHNTSSQNVAIGWGSMTCWSWGTSGSTSSNYNTCLGYQSGNGSLVGDYNVFIGHGVSTTASPTSRVSKRIVIGTSSSMVGSTIDDYPISVNMEAPVPYGKHNYKNLPLRFQLPNLTKTQRDALASKTIGEMIWQTDSGNSGIRVFDGTNWLALQTTID